MDESVIKKEKQLEELRIDHEISDERAAIAEKRALEAKLKKEYGHDWKKILGYAKGLKPNREAIQDMYSINPELKDLTRPPDLSHLRK